MKDPKPQSRRRYHKRSAGVSTPSRLKGLQLALAAATIVLVGRLLHLQILQHGVYEALASGQRELYQDLFPERGDILVRDRDGTEMAIATNRYLNLVWAEPRRIDDPVRTAQVLSDLLDISKEPILEGFLFSELDAAGNWISIGARNFHDAQDGADVVLTIDRTIQHVACTKIQEAVERYEADSGSVVILDAKTGAIRAMCGAPSFDPNVYNEVESISVYNNQTIFGAYEPGSIFKPLVMAAGLDVGSVTPSSVYEDTGEVKIDRFTIRNSDLKAHGIQTMTEVLEKSLNTGMIYVMHQMGGDVLARYVHDFGFGEATGVRLDTEVAGDISAVDRGYEIYSATSSYGQGLTVTPLQMVQEIRHANGKVEKTEPTELRRVLSAKTAQMVTAMLVSTVENGHAGSAGASGYYIAGKTGTAQVANDQGTYQSDATIASFAGYGPARDPRFVMLVRIDHPRTSPWAASTAAPVFGEIADFLLQYLQIPPERT